MVKYVNDDRARSDYWRVHKSFSDKNVISSSSPYLYWKVSSSIHTRVNSKRRDELAVQLGKMVVEHLLTPEGIGKKLTNEEFQKGLIQWTQVEVDKVITNEQSLRQMLEKWNLVHVEKEATEKIEHVITEKIEAFLAEYYTYTWEQALPHSVHEKIENTIPNVSAFILNRGIHFFESEEGKHVFQK